MRCYAGEQRKNHCGRVITHAESYVCEIDGRLMVGI